MRPFVGHALPGVLGRRHLICGKAYTSYDAAHHVPFWVKPCRLCSALGIWPGLDVLHDPGLPRNRRRHSQGLTVRSCNKWYFDELSTGCSCGPLIGRRVLWQRGDRRSLTASGRMGCRRLAKRRRCRQSCRPAIVYHYAFAMLIGVVALVRLVSCQREADAMASDAPSIARHLPAACRALMIMLFARGGRGQSTNAAGVALWTSRLCSWSRFWCGRHLIPTTRRFQMSRRL